MLLMMYFREVYVIFSAASQCSLYFYGVSTLRYLTANIWDATGPRSHDIRTGLCATLTLPFHCSLLHVHVWMDDCFLAEKLLHQTNNDLNSTQTISSPVRVTQPSSTQDSFAKSKSLLLCLSVCLSLPSFCHSWPGWTPLSSLPPRG